MYSLRRFLGRHAAYPLMLTAMSVRRCGGWRPMRQLRRLRELARSEPHMWQAFRDHQLRVGLTNALEHIPFYRPLAARLLPLVAEDPGRALEQFPILTKRVMQERGEELMADRVPPGGRHTTGTGGSTGEPTHFWHDHRRDAFRLLVAYRDKMHTGWRPGDPGALIESPRAQFWSISRLRRALNRLGKTYVGLNVHGMTPAANREFLETMERHRPVYLRGIASGLGEFARFLEAEGLVARARDLGLRTLISMCEPLFPPVRQRVERVFGTRVCDLYGSVEMGTVATECMAHRGLHVAADTLVLEVLDDEDKPVPRGERGRIVVTDPWNLGYSMVRVDLGDVGRALPDDGPCPCGVTLPRIAPVEGRSIDFLTLPDGRRIWGTEFSKHLHDFPGVRQFQVVQEAVDELRVLLVGERAIIEPRLPQLEAQAPAGVRLRIEFRDAIALSRAGKRLTVVSHVRSADAGE